MSVPPQPPAIKKPPAKVIEIPQKIGVPFVLDVTKQRIFHTWLRGVKERKIARMYGFRRHEVEAIIREQVSGFSGRAA